MRKLHWVVVSGLMVLSLVLAACGPAATTAQPTAPTPPTSPVTPTAPATPTTPTPQEPQQKPQNSSAETPKYGGTLTYRISSDPVNFDSGINRMGGALLGTVYQQFISTDWARGPAGSKAIAALFVNGSFDDFGGQVAESWSMPEIGVWKLQIRRGIHWQPVNSPAGQLMGGRELTADDIVDEFNRLLNKDGRAPSSWIFVGTGAAAAKAATIQKTGPWEVTMRTPVEYMTAYVYLIPGAGFYRVYPPGVVAKYGNMGDWHNSVGTGPFMLTDYVPGTQMLYQKNPLYWEKDPVGPGKGNQLPYVDTLRELIIPDLSTTLAAFRTGKLDLQAGVGLVDATGLWKTAPKAQYFRYLDNTWIIAMRQDKPGKPFSDVRVRQALMLASDLEQIKKFYYGGEAEIDVWPMNKDITALYKPLNEMPPEVQDLYKYNPEKAKQLLKEAGYPNGFKTSIVCQTFAERIDELSLFKDMWAKVGIDLTIEPKETGAYAIYTSAGNPYEDMLYRSVGPSFTISLYMGNTRGPGIWNPSHVNDPPGSLPYMEDLFNQFNSNVFVNNSKLYELVKQQNTFLMAGAYSIPRPSPYLYNFWWPWLKNHYGQGPGFVRYAWIDPDLKKAMGH